MFAEFDEMLYNFGQMFTKIPKNQAKSGQNSIKTVFFVHFSPQICI